MPPHFAINPDLDLVFDRIIEIAPEAVWSAWTQPEHLIHWFTPRPWTVTACEIDLRPGGVFRTTMRSPEGQEFPHVGCYLEVEPPHRLVWTDALHANYRPAEKPFVTASLTFERQGSGTHYRAIVLHATVEDRQKHEAMNFAAGWGTALDQLVAHMQSI